MKPLTAFAAALTALVLAACSSQDPGGGDVAVFEGGHVALFGGRERLIFQWDGFPSDAEKVILSGRDGRHYEILTPWESGEASVSGVPEGTYHFLPQIRTASGDLMAQELSVTVLGDRYEAELHPWRLESARWAGTRCHALFSRQIPGNLRYEEFSWTGSAGKSESILLDSRETVEIWLRDVKEGLRHRSVFYPEPRSGDAFFTPWTELVPPEPKTPSAEEIAQTVDGYRGIWFTLGQVKTEYGDKYSGGLGTYTMKHIPMAVYSPEADRTYFVYGGTPAEDRKYLQCMIGCYDHASGLLQRPRVVMDKGQDGVLDPHDDPTVQIDKDGYIWVFVAGRSTKRMGRRYRSVNPYDITAFTYINESYMAYPQVFYDPVKGFFLFFTRYDGVRQLFWQTSKDGVNWTPYRQLASIKEGSETKSGHYQISNMWGTKVCTAFNRHINGNVDTRTNIYFLQSTDWGETWTTADGKKVTVPVTTRTNDALVKDYQAEGKNCYIKDVNFDKAGNPIILYLISDSYLTGPEGGKREWFTLAWDGGQWQQTKLTESTHCYDSGSLWTEGDEWTILAPTAPGPQYWGAGGEVQRWRSTDHGLSWTLCENLTENSTYNQTYVRRPLGAADGFYAFWADGDPDHFSRSSLYFCDREGRVFRMPYEMASEWQAPELVKP